MHINVSNTNIVLRLIPLFQNHKIIGAETRTLTKTTAITSGPGYPK